MLLIDSLIVGCLKDLYFLEAKLVVWIVDKLVGSERLKDLKRILEKVVLVLLGIDNWR